MKKTDDLASFELQYEELPKKSNRGNTKKDLTKQNKGSKIESVNLKRKDNKMVTHKKQTSKKSDYVKSVAWLVEAGFRGFVGWILLSNFDHLATTAVAFYALGTAGIIVVTHFVKAHK